MVAEPKPLPPENRLWTPHDVAHFLAVSRSWVYRAAERGELPCLHVGALVRFEPDAIRRWTRGERPTVAAVLSLASGIR